MKHLQGSPLSKGIFQFDMWNVEPTDRWDWDTLERRSNRTWRKKFFAGGTNANCFYFADIWQQ